jgi:hypothetical protein
VEYSDLAREMIVEQVRRKLSRDKQDFSNDAIR